MTPLDQLGKAAFELAMLDKRVAELTAAARYLMVALHGCANDGAGKWSRAEIQAIARGAAMKWPDLAPGSDEPTTPPRSS